MATKVTKILYKRGNKENMPILDASEIALAIDTNELFYGTGTENIRIATMDEVNELMALTEEAKATAEAAIAAAK